MAILIIIAVFISAFLLWMAVINFKASVERSREKNKGYYRNHIRF